MKKLIFKRCPFCESDGAWLVDRRSDGSIWWAYCCDNKKCGVKPQTAFCESKEKAAEIWNDRPKNRDEIWVMEFVFNEEKARTLGYSAETCYEAVDKLFARYGIAPTSQGVYEAPDSQNTFDAFCSAQRLTHTNWFLKVIEEWSCYEDGDFEDCLATFYEINERND